MAEQDNIVTVPNPFQPEAVSAPNAPQSEPTPQPQPAVAPSFTAGLINRETVPGESFIEQPQLNQNQLTEAAAEEAHHKIGTVHLLGNSVRNWIEAGAYERFTAPEFQRDPNFTTQAFEDRLKQASPNLPPEYQSALSDAVSPAHFDYLYGVQRQRYQEQLELANQGAGIAVANFAINLADPAAWALGGGLGRIASGALEGETLARAIWANKAVTHGVSGAVAGAGIEATRDAVGFPTSAESYLYTAGSGMVLGGLLGQWARNPAISDEVSGLIKVGESMKAEAVQTASKRLETNPDVQSAVDAALNPSRQSLPTSAANDLEVTGTQASVQRAFDAAMSRTGEELPSPANQNVTPAQQAIQTAAEEAIGVPGSRRPRPANDVGGERIPFEERARREGRNFNSPDELGEGDAARARNALNRALNGSIESLKPANDGVTPTTATADNGVQGALDASLNTPTKAPTPANDTGAPEPTAVQHIAQNINDAVNGKLPDLNTTIRKIVDEALSPVVKEGETVSANAASESGEVARAGLLFENPEAAITSGSIDRATQAADIEAGRFTPSFGPKSLSAGADFVPGKTWLDDVDYAALQHADVDAQIPTGALGHVRFDRAAWLTTSKNPLARLLAPFILNDSVGNTGHTRNPFSADLMQVQYYEKVITDVGRTYEPAFNAWAKAQGYNWSNRLGFFNGQNQKPSEIFNSLITDFIRDRGRVPGQYAAEVERVGNKIASKFDEMREDMANPLKYVGKQGRPISQADLIPEDQHYLWRKWLPENILSAVNKYGENNVKALFKGAIRDAQPDLPDNILTKIANGMVDNLTNRAAGLGDEWAIAFAQGKRDQLAALLRGAGLEDDEINDVFHHLAGKPPKEGEITNLKRRVLLNENYEHQDVTTISGETGPLAIRDLLENDALRLFQGYTRRASGAIALARVTIPHPVDGGELINGIVSQAERDQLVEQVTRMGMQKGLTTADTKWTADQLNFAFESILGNQPGLDKFGTWLNVLRLIKSWNASTKMGQVGVAQFGEAGSLVGALGVKAMRQHMPAMGTFIDSAGDIRITDQMQDELMSMGLGAKRLHGFRMMDNGLDENGLPFEMPKETWLGKWQRRAKFAEEATYRWSLNNAVQDRQEQWTAAAMTQNVANIAARVANGKTLGRGELRRMAQLGLDEARLKPIFEQMAKWTTAEDKIDFNGKINVLNLDKWDNLQARADLENSVFRMTRKLIQTGDLGSGAQWMSNPIWQAILQFRGYMFTAWANQFLYGIHINDPGAYVGFASSVAWNAAVRGAQVLALSATRSDAQQYRDKNLSAWELGKAGFQRAGWTSVIPTGIDTGLVMLRGQGQGMFQARNSGQSSDLWFGNPVSSLMNSAVQGVGGTLHSLGSGQTPSQDEARALAGLIPFSNLMPNAMITSGLISPLPMHSKQEKPPY